MYYNFVKIHSTLIVIPAIAAKTTHRLWEIGDIVKLLEANEADNAPTKRGLYKKGKS